MRIREILSYLKEYIIIGLVGIIIIGLLFLIGYKFIYQKLMKGKRKIKLKRLILYGISICYFAVVLGAVFLNRVDGYEEINLYLFSSYFEAYNKMSISLFRNLILNILLFLPLGIFLPLYNKKLDKFYKVIPIGFLLTLIIEIIQYITGYGIFEIDDIFNNTIGTIIGYGLYKTYLNIRNKENKKYIFIYLMPIVILTLSFIGMYITYQNKELGNLPFETNYKINMKDVNITSNIEVSDKTEIKPIYYLKAYTEKETRKMANNLYNKLGTSVREEDIEMYIYEDGTVYHSKDGGYSMWINYDDGSYDFTDYSQFNKNITGKTGATKEEVLSALNKIYIEIPEKNTFKEINGSYIFDVSIKEEDYIIEGKLKCGYYSDNTVKRVKNNIIKYSKVKEKEIISEKEAYEKILAGKFLHIRNTVKIKDLVINDINLKYYLDTKGYYVPVYSFNTKINGYNAEILIKAVK